MQVLLFLTFSDNSTALAVQPGPIQKVFLSPVTRPQKDDLQSEIPSSKTGLSQHISAFGSWVGWIFSSPPSAAICNFLNSFSIPLGSTTDEELL